MPELPDVEILRKYFNCTSLNQVVTQVDVRSKKILEVNNADLIQALKHHEFAETRRHGKHLFAKLNKQWLMFHFGMTGDLKYFKNMKKDPKHDRLLLTFSNGYHLAFINQRLLGKVDLTNSVEDFIEKNNLGPDAMEITLENFQKIFNRRKNVKKTLMDQKLVAGVGNIYADEILFQSKIHPKTQSKKLTKNKIKEIYETMKHVFKIAIKNNADPEQFPRSYIIPYRKEGKKCPNCKEKIQRIEVSGRGAFICPKCQKK